MNIVVLEWTNVWQNQQTIPVMCWLFVEAETVMVYGETPTRKEAMEAYVRFTNKFWKKLEIFDWGFKKNIFSVL